MKLNQRLNWVRLDYSFGNSLLEFNPVPKVHLPQDFHLTASSVSSIRKAYERFRCVRGFRLSSFTSHPIKLQNLTNLLREKQTMCRRPCKSPGLPLRHRMNDKISVGFSGSCTSLLLRPSLNFSLQLRENKLSAHR